MGYKQRRAYSYTNKRNNSRAASCVAAYLNPMRDSLQNVKIPDGAANLSCGIRYIDRYLVTNSNVDDNLYFVFTPDKERACYSRVTAAPDEVMGEPGTTANVHVNVIPDDSIGYFRMVSKGSRIIPTMNSDNNEGYFEAIRVPTLSSTSFNFNGMTENPSYINGKLKDLSRYLFQNKPLDTSHRFMEGNQDAHLDGGYDTILVKISGASKTLGTLLVHTVANWEFQFVKTSTTDYRRFMDGAVNDQNGLHRAQAILMSSIKAGQLSAY